MKFIILFFLLILHPSISQHQQKKKIKKEEKEIKNEESYLDSNYWITKVTSTYQDNDSNYIIPLICQFQNIYLDSFHIYFIPQPSRYRNASEDLFHCCLNTYEGGFLHRTELDCSKSVSYHLCRCFHNLKYVPSIISSSMASKISLHYNLTNITWLMNHWSFNHHPDHFAMKILELHGHSYNYKIDNLPWNSSFPSYISQLVSMDYPGNFFTDYERMTLSFLYRLIGKEIPYYFVYKPPHGNIGTRLNNRFYLNIIEIIAPLCINYSVTTIKTTTKINNLIFPTNLTLYELCQLIPPHYNFICPNINYLEHAYLSPIYKNNIPFPYDTSANGLRISFKQYVQNHSTLLHNDTFDDCVTNNYNNNNSNSNQRPALHPRVAIIQRSEGNGLRQFDNLNDVLLAVQRITLQEKIDILYINSKTPGILQAARFCQYHLIISPHTSQLANLVYSPINISVIEIQNPRLIEETFLSLGKKVQLHYQLLKKGIILSFLYIFISLFLLFFFFMLIL